MYDIEEFVQKISEKFGYNEELKKVLIRIIPVMIKNKSPKMVELFFEMLENVKIRVMDTSRPTSDEVQKMIEEEFGEEILIAPDRGEYGKGVAAGSFQYDLSVDEDMNIIGSKSFLYVSRLNSYQKELIEIFGTDINLAHLIHELGHAWAAYFKEYELDENGGVHNTGFAKERFYIDKEKRKAIINQYDGLITEEAINTIEEEDTLLDLLQIDSIDELKKVGYVQSKYQGFIVMIMRMYVQQFGKLPFDMYRFLRDDTGLKQVESELKNTEAWTEMQKEEFTIRKRRTFSLVDELEIKEQSRQTIKDFFSYYEKDFFPDNSKFSPMEKLENVLTQLYNMESIKWSFGIVGNEKCQEIYRTIMMSILTEASVMIRQVEKKKQNPTDDSNDYRGEY